MACQIIKRCVKLLLLALQEISLILNELLSAEGNETYVRPSRVFVHEGEQASFWEVAARARVRGECAIGFAEVGEGSYNVHLNPADKRAKRTWSAADRVIVFAVD